MQIPDRAEEVPEIDEPGEAVEPAQAENLDKDDDVFGRLWSTAVEVLSNEKYAHFHQQIAEIMIAEMGMKCEFPASGEGASASSSSGTGIARQEPASTTTITSSQPLQKAEPRALKQEHLKEEKI